MPPTDITNNIGTVADIPSNININYSAIYGFLPKLLWIVILSVLVIILIKFMSHRVIVEVYEKTRGGYVVKGGRYAIAYDAKLGLEYLRPMWGKTRLPMFPLEYFQVTRGMPIIGVKREIMLIKQNHYSYKVLYPTNDFDNEGKIIYTDSLAWIYLEHKRKFIEQTNKEEFIQRMFMVVPVVMIIMAIIFWIVMMFLQASITSHEADQITQTLNAIKEVYVGT